MAIEDLDRRARRIRYLFVNKLWNGLGGDPNDDYNYPIIQGLKVEGEGEDAGARRELVSPNPVWFEGNRFTQIPRRRFTGRDHRAQLPVYLSHNATDGSARLHPCRQIFASILRSPQRLIGCDEQARRADI